MEKKREICPGIFVISDLECRLKKSQNQRLSILGNLRKLENEELHEEARNEQKRQLISTLGSLGRGVMSFSDEDWERVSGFLIKNDYEVQEDRRFNRRRVVKKNNLDVE